MEESIKKEKIAFNSIESFKNCITNKEFEIILSIAEEKHQKMSSLIKERANLVFKAKQKVEEVKDKMKEEHLELAVKMTKALIHKADSEMYEAFKNEIESYSHLVNFLNRFRKPNELHEELDITFLDKFKKQ